LEEAALAAVVASGAEIPAAPALEDLAVTAAVSAAAAQAEVGNELGLCKRGFPSRKLEEKSTV
jgi:hypothetical protein